MTKQKVTIFLLLVSLFSFSAKIDSIVSTVNLKKYSNSFSFNEYTTVYKTNKDISLSDLLFLIKNNKIQAADNKPTRGFNKDYYWVFFKIKTTTDLVIRNATTNIDKAYLFNIKSPLDTLVKLGTKLKLSEKSIKTEQIMFPIKASFGNEEIFVIKLIKMHDSLSFPLTLYSSTDYDKMLRSKDFLYLIFFSIMFILNITSLIFGILLNKRIFLYYSFYSLMVIVTYGTFKNIFSSVLYPEIPEINSYFKNITMLLVFSFNVFSLKFLNVAKFSKKIANIFILMNIVSLVFLFTSLITPHYFRYYIFSSYYIIFIIYILFFLIVLFVFYRNKVENTIIFIIAFSPVVVATMITALISIKILPSYLLSYDLPIYGTLIEFVVFIIAILFEAKKLNDQRNTLIKEASDKKRKILMAFADGSDDASSFTSEELHDNIGSQLALLKHKINSEDDSLILSDIDRIKHDVLGITNSIDNKTVKLLGLKQSLENFIYNFNKRVDIKVSVTNNNFNDVKGDNAMQILRVVQEALTNALKYSEATNISIILQKNTILIKDNGKGFNLKKVEQKTTNGILNMKKRIQNIGGKLSINSSINKGTEIKIVL